MVHLPQNGIPLVLTESHLSLTSNPETCGDPALCLTKKQSLSWKGKFSFISRVTAPSIGRTTKGLLFVCSVLLSNGPNVHWGYDLDFDPWPGKSTQKSEGEVLGPHWMLTKWYSMSFEWNMLATHSLLAELLVNQ